MFIYEIANNKDGEIKIQEELLDTDERASARANAEFLEGAYSKATCQFSTFMTDFEVNDIVEVEGLSYRIIDIQIRWDEKEIYSEVSGVRYAS